MDENPTQWVEPIREYRDDLSACLDSWEMSPDRQRRLRVALAEGCLEGAAGLREERERAAKQLERAKRERLSSEHPPSYRETGKGYGCASPSLTTCPSGSPNGPLGTWLGTVPGSNRTRPRVGAVMPTKWRCSTIGSGATMS